MLGSDEGAGLGEEAPEFVHRMASNRSGQIRAFARPDNMFIGDGEISASGQSRDQVFGEKNRFGWPRRSNRTLADGSGDLYRHIIDGSEEHTSELQSLMRNSYAVFCLKKKKK